MTKINVIVSNFLNANSKVTFDKDRFKYSQGKSSEDFDALDCSEIESLSYDKPSGHTDAHRGNGLFSASINLFSALQFIKKGKQIEFNVRFKDGKHLVGLTSMDEYFEIQNAWLEAK